MEMNSSNLLWFFAFLFLCGGNGGVFGNNRVPNGPPPASQQDVNEAVNNQTVNQMLNNLGIETANNNLRTVQAVADQTAFLQGQMNTYNVNAIQGFNEVNRRIDQLGAQLESCCCSIKTTLLQQQLDAARANEVRLQNQLDNRDQTQVLLGTLGRWVAWAGNGTQAAAAAG